MSLKDLIRKQVIKSLEKEKKKRMRDLIEKEKWNRKFIGRKS